MKLHQEPEAVQVATLLSVVGAEVRKVFAMFTDWASDTDQNKIQPVLQKFAAYCQPLKARGAASGDIFARHLVAHQRIWN